MEKKLFFEGGDPIRALVDELVCFDEIPSTNLYLRERVAGGEGGLILALAESQSAGRGRLGRSFFSPPGSGIYMSLLLPCDSSFDPTRLTVRVGVATHRALCRCFPSLEAKIKWVNDILVHGKKLAGILVEGVYAPNGDFFAVIGIGINSKRTAFPEELCDVATDIESAVGYPPVREELIRLITREILSVTREDFDGVLTSYRENSYLLGMPITVYPHGAEPYGALALDVDGDGALVVKRENGEICALHSGDVSVRRA